MSLNILYVQILNFLIAFETKNVLFANLAAAEQRIHAEWLRAGPSTSQSRRRIAGCLSDKK